MRYEIFVVGPRGGRKILKTVETKTAALEAMRGIGAHISLSRPPLDTDAPALIFDGRKARPTATPVVNDNRAINDVIKDMLDPVNSFSRRYERVPLDALTADSETMHARFNGKTKRGARVVVQFPKWTGTGKRAGSFSSIQTIEAKIVNFDRKSIEFVDDTNTKYRKRLTPNVKIALAVGKNETL